MSGEPVDLRPEPGKRVDASDGEGWSSSRAVEASMLSSLLTVAIGADGWTYRPLRLAGARITGALDLESATLTRPLYLQDCFLEDPVKLNDAHAITIRLAGCHLPGIIGSALHTSGDLRLNDGFTAIGNVDLRSARIGGALNCDGGTFTNRNGVALNAGSLTVDGDMFCSGKFTATGPVILGGAHISGVLNCNGGTFTSENQTALDARSLTVDGNMLCSGKFTATGAVNLGGAHIGGTLNCDGGTFTSENQTALDARSLTVDGDMFCSGKFTATGPVILGGAHISGALNCNGGTFTSENQTALDARSLTVDGNMLCSGKFTATGPVILGGAHIGGALDCDGGTFTNRNGVALNAGSLTVDGDMFCSGKFTATGPVILGGAHISGVLNCNGGTFTSENQTALDARSLTVDGNMLCSGKFTATGAVNLGGAHIGGTLDCDGGTFTNGNDLALGLHRAEVAKDVIFRPTSLTGEVNLSFAKVGGWRDAEATWPDKGKLSLNGFTYPIIDAEPPVTPRRRLQWLQRDAKGFLPQPYDQLANTYRLQGDDGAAREVQISAQWHRRAAVNSPSGLVLRPFRLLWSALLWATIGYGYRPWQILAPIGILYGFGCWWFTRAAEHGGIVRAENLDPHVQFNGARYAADLLIPGAGLGERANFLAIGQTAWWAAGYTLAGWALAAMLIAGLTGVFKRQ